MQQTQTMLSSVVSKVNEFFHLTCSAWRAVEKIPEQELDAPIQVPADYVQSLHLAKQWRLAVHRLRHHTRKGWKMDLYKVAQRETEFNLVHKYKLPSE